MVCNWKTVLRLSLRYFLIILPLITEIEREDKKKNRTQNHHAYTPNTLQLKVYYNKKCIKIRFFLHKSPGIIIIDINNLHYSVRVSTLIQYNMCLSVCLEAVPLAAIYAVAVISWNQFLVFLVCFCVIDCFFSRIIIVFLLLYRVENLLKYY